MSNIASSPAGSTPTTGVAPGDVVAGLQAAARAAKCAVYLGRGDRGWAWAGEQRPTLVLGPTRSGKTSSIIVPNVLAAPGAVVSTSTKPDVMHSTAPGRSGVGAALCYDPTGSVEPERNVLRVGWSPVNASRDWDLALATADAMVRSRLMATSAPVDHWSERATSLLAPLLHAAARSEEPMSTVQRWVDRRCGDVALAALIDSLGDSHPAVDVLHGILVTDGREQSGIWSTASGVLHAYHYLGARSSTDPPFLDAVEFCEGAHTLYVCAPGRLQQLVAPLVVGMLTEIRDAAYERARRGEADPPVLLALDEVANIAPLPDLPAIVTEGAGQGLLTLACLQDLSQARARWGRQADSFLSLFGCTVVLPGIGDLPTLEGVSQLAGEVELPTRSVSKGRGLGPGPTAQRSVTVSTVFRRRAAVDVIGRGRPGSALCVDARNRVGWVELTPSYATAPWTLALGSRAKARDGLGR